MTENEERVFHLIESVRKNSPTGAAVLREAEARGCTFDFESQGDTYGFYDDEHNKVVLNPVYADAELFSTLVHESRHALQPPEYIDPRSNIRTNIQNVRIKEADAMAFECAAAYEMKSFCPQGWDEFNKKHKVIGDAYAENILKSNKKALSAAFEAWHSDFAYMDGYDQQTADGLFHFAPRCAERGLSKNKEGRQMIRDVCLLDGKCYQECAFADSRQAMTMTEGDALKRLQSLQRIMKNVHEVDDVSLDSFYLRAGNGKITPPRVQAVKVFSEKQFAAVGKDRKR